MTRFNCVAAVVSQFSLGCGSHRGRRSDVALMSSTVTDHEHRYAARRHGDTVVDGFRRLWLEQQLCDTRLRVGTRTFNAHRCFLAASSRYFHSMFTDGFRESAQQEVELRGVSAGGVSALLEYAYTGAVTISATSLADILEAADHLQFAEVQEFCAQYLKEEVRPPAGSRATASHNCSQNQ